MTTFNATKMNMNVGLREVATNLFNTQVVVGLVGGQDSATLTFGDGGTVSITIDTNGNAQAYFRLDQFSAVFEALNWAISHGAVQVDIGPNAGARSVNVSIAGVTLPTS